MLAHEPPNLADVRPMLSPMLAPTPSRSQSFRSGPPPNTQNHGKTHRFLTSPRRNPWPTKATKLCKKRGFLNTTRRIHCKLQRGTEVRGGSAAGASTHKTFGYQPKASGKDTGCGPGPAPGFMRLTPDSRAPAKADPSARAGVGVVVVGVGVVVVGRCWPYLGAGLPLSWPSVGPCSPHLGCGCRCRPFFFWLLLLLSLSLLLVLLLLADVGPIWAQVCPCLGPRLAHVAHILA